MRNEIREMMKGFDSPREFYVGRLTEGIATLGAAFYPKRVIVRLSDFKSNEYANLVGGERYEPDEENPMLASVARDAMFPTASATVSRWSVKQ